jgi:(1->4)-alpha-D-glucan 1-alpha-D-glucosylmutase
VMAQTLAADVLRLVALLRDICAQRPRHRDHTDEELRVAVSELIAALPVYRTYRGDADDERRLQAAVAEVRRLRPEVDAELLSLIVALVLDGDSDFGMRLPQLAAAVMAKGMEDTTFYRVVTLAALNEVGGGPRPFSATIEHFHAHNALVQEKWPQTLLATTTHDTKRSEDVRARLVLLAEMPEEWAATVLAWRDRNVRHRRGDLPDAVMECLLYQSMVGAWPIDRERMLAYMDKASREAKLHTSWIDPSPAYDAALRDFVVALYGDEDFLESVAAFVAPLVTPGRVNALSTLLLKLTSPGVPDVYQGCESWALSLVDPDNRRPVDFAARRALLTRAHEVSAAQAWRDEADTGLPKLLLLHRALKLRERRPELFGAAGAYTPLQVRGDAASHAIAYARGATPGAVTVVPRLPLGLRDWSDTAVSLPDGEWLDQLCGQRFAGETRVADLLRDFPVALLAREAA